MSRELLCHKTQVLLNIAPAPAQWPQEASRDRIIPIFEKEKLSYGDMSQLFHGCIIQIAPVFVSCLPAKGDIFQTSRLLLRSSCDAVSPVKHPKSSTVQHSLASNSSWQQLATWNGDLSPKGQEWVWPRAVSSAGGKQTDTRHLCFPEVWPPHRWQTGQNRLPVLGSSSETLDNSWQRTDSTPGWPSSDLSEWAGGRKTPVSASIQLTWGSLKCLEPT